MILVCLGLLHLLEWSWQNALFARLKRLVNSCRSCTPSWIDHENEFSINSRIGLCNNTTCLCFEVWNDSNDNPLADQRWKLAPQGANTMTKRAHEQQGELLYRPVWLQRCFQHVWPCAHLRGYVQSMNRMVRNLMFWCCLNNVFEQWHTEGPSRTTLILQSSNVGNVKSNSNVISQFT